jgi:polyhydroxyalkanoate synthesis regulator phasin
MADNKKDDSAINKEEFMERLQKSVNGVLKDYKLSEQEKKNFLKDVNGELGKIAEELGIEKEDIEKMKKQAKIGENTWARSLRDILGDSVGKSSFLDKLDDAFLTTTTLARAICTTKYDLPKAMQEGIHTFFDYLGEKVDKLFDETPKKGNTEITASPGGKDPFVKLKNSQTPPTPVSTPRGNNQSRNNGHSI